MKYILLIISIVLVSCECGDSSSSTPTPTPKPKIEAGPKKAVTSGSLSIIRHDFDGYRNIEVVIDNKHNIVCYHWAGDFGCASFDNNNVSGTETGNPDILLNKIKELEDRIRQLETQGY